MKIVGAGFGRTGTSSLQAALSELCGGACYHMGELQKHPEHIPIWRQAAQGEAVDWQAFFKDYVAVLDWPCATFYKEIVEAHPDAKVVLTLRDFDAWYDSCLSTIYPLSTMYRSAPVSWMLPLTGEYRSQFPDMVFETVWGEKATFGGRFEDRDHTRRVFEEHAQAVQCEVPADRLLVFDVKQGWEPLCAFLDVPVPDRPFPHLNRRRLLQRVRRNMTIMGWMFSPVTAPLAFGRKMLGSGSGIARLTAAPRTRRVESSWIDTERDRRVSSPFRETPRARKSAEIEWQRTSK